MQTTSALYNTILADSNHWFETRVLINNVVYDETKLFSVSTHVEMFQNTPTLGKAVAGEISVKMLKPSVDIPSMAKIQPQVRVCRDFGEEIGDEWVVTRQNSEWLAQGIYYIDTRETTKNQDGLDVLTLHGYDDMLKAEQDYPDTDHAWPYLDISVVNEIAQTMGVQVDSRVAEFITAGYMVNLPTGYSMRETLGNIAAAYAGSFIMSPEGKLMFVPVYGLDPDVEGSYLADENGNALVFGNEGWCILV